MTRTASFELEPLGPFSLAASARFLEGFAPAARAPSRTDHLHLAFPVDGSDDASGLCVRQPGGADHPVSVEVLAGTASSAVREQAARILSLDVDGRAYPAAGRRDPTVGRLQARYPGLRPVAFHSPYEAAAWALISARLRIGQASRLKARMAERLGVALDLHGERLHAFPPPGVLAALADFPGLVGRKAEWLRGIGEATLAGRLDASRLRSLPEAEALADLQELSGIGPFSAGLILLRGANLPDALPAGEPRLARAVALGYGLDEVPSLDEVRRLAEAWRPYRTWVTVLLRRQLEDETGEIGGAGQASRTAAPARRTTRR